MKRLIIMAVVCLGVAAVVAGCCRCRFKSRTTRPLEGSSWSLVQLMGQSVTPEKGQFTLTFSNEGRLNGRGSCNTINGNYSIPERGKLEFGPLASTRMMCPDIQRESKFFAVVNGATSYEIDGDTLLLFHDGELQAVFEYRNE